jgi:FixJ family two-component response regulator
MDRQTEIPQIGPAVCVIESDPGMNLQLGKLLAYLDSPIIHYQSAESFLAESEGIEVGCILADGDQLGEKSPEFIAQLSQRGLSGATIIIARQANIDDAVKALQQGIADYIEIPQPDRLLLAKIRQVISRTVSASGLRTH